MATRILVVDDSPTLRHVVSAILERHGYDPKVASDGRDAYQALVSGEVSADLVLVDFVMPNMNGYQFCRALRENVALAATPVVLMSAKSDRIRDQFVQQTGALDAITKPFDAQALLFVIENALRKVNTTRASSARLPEVESGDVTTIAPSFVSSPIEFETRRTHVAQIVAQKLASIVARAISERPDVVSSPNLVTAIADRLSNDAIVEMMEVVGDLTRNDDPRTLLTGDLGVIPIGAILQLLQGENQTGVLVCTHGGAEVRTIFRGGSIDLVQSIGAGDEFRLGRFFIEEGILTSREIEEVAALASLKRAPVMIDAADAAPQSNVQSVQRESPSPEEDPPPRASIVETSFDDPHAAVTLPGAALVEKLALTPPTRPLGMALLLAGKIEDAQLRTALTRQSSELLYEVLRWSTGRFEFRREPPSEFADGAKLAMPVASVVMEGFRRIDEWRVLERTLGKFDAVLFRDDAAFGALDVESLPIRERAVLDAVDGERTVRAVVSASQVSSFDACRILVQFLEARVLRRLPG